MKRQVALLATALILAGVVWIAPSPLVRYCLAFPLLWLLPGLSWATLIPRRALDRVERLVVALGLNFVITPTVALLVAYLPGPVTRASLIVAIEGVIGVPAVLCAAVRVKRRRACAPVSPHIDADSDASTGLGLRVSILTARHSMWRDGWAWLLVAVLIAVGLRFVNLGYSEFQGDEAKVMVRTALALEGDEDIVFQHKKGPAQLATVMPGWRLTGVTNEWMARLPFAWVSVLGIAAVFLCGRRLGRPHAGGVAACLLAIEGYLLGFGRIVQYQSLVFALGVLGLFCLLAYSTRGHGSLAILGAAFFAGGVLAHYDAIMALPAGLFLVGARLWLDGRRVWRALMPVAAAALVGVVLAGLFYLPFLRSPYVGYTSSYVYGRIGGRLYNNLWSTFELSAVYDTTYFLGAMLLALVTQTVVVWTRWGRAALVSSCVLVGVAIAGWIRPELWTVDQLTLTWVPVAILLVGALLSPGQSLAARSMWLWLGLPVIFYLFLVASPLTHVYTIFPAWAVLAGIGLDNLARWLAGRSRVALRIAGMGGLALYALCGAYAAMMFVDHTPEYRRTYPQFKSPIYWTPYEQMPSAGLFGFPYRAGWKVVGYLMDEGQLVGSYSSNEKEKVTKYYTRQAVRLDCASPDMYVTATNVQDEVSVPWHQIEAEYHPAVEVSVNGQPKLTVHERAVVGTPSTYQVEEYEQLFDLGSTPDRVARPASLGIGPMDTEGYTSREAIVGDFAHLLGYKIDAAHAVSGGYVELTLLWQALKPAPIDYQVFTHLYDGERMRGQLDGQPVCGSQPTSRWLPGQLIADPYRIPIRDDALPGPVPLTVGMYSLVTMERLPVSAADGAPAGDSVHLTDLAIRTP
jgi:4-amino-4-deoxy-L-arabinose transferase-like glycosyltransferase